MLSNMITQWSRVMEIERLALARQRIGSQTPLDFLRGWKSPDELHQPQYSESPATEDT